jgi:hypothetical protein
MTTLADIKFFIMKNGSDKYIGMPVSEWFDAEFPAVWLNARSANRWLTKHTKWHNGHDAYIGWIIWDPVAERHIGHVRAWAKRLSETA